MSHAPDRWLSSASATADTRIETTSAEVLLQLDGVSMHYGKGETAITALAGVDLAVRAGELVAIMGASGSGKSTLLTIAGGLTTPTSGEVVVQGQWLSTMSPAGIAALRRRTLGFVFQDFNLIPVLTVYENIEYPLVMVQDWPEPKRRRQIMRLLEAVDMVTQAHKRPDQISGGQKQRVAVARALATDPQLVLADEPTANLDRDTAYRIIRLMKKMRDELGTTFVFSTHDPKIMDEAEVIYYVEDGRVREPSAARETAHV